MSTFLTKDDKALENNERIKRTGYERAFDNFADKARDSTHPFHRTYQQMKRINHHRGGAPKVTPFGVNIYGILSKDAHQAMGRLSEIRFPEAPHCLSYLSARQKWIGWWIRVIQKYISESVVCRIEARFKHRARLADDLLTASHNQMGSPVQRPLIQIGMHKWGLQQEEPKATVNFTAKQASASTGNAAPNSNNEDLKRRGGEVFSDYEIARRKQMKENAVRLRDIMASHNNIRPHSPQQPAKLERTQSTNNCGYTP
jgi:hypothetical protein